MTDVLELNAGTRRGVIVAVTGLGRRAKAVDVGVIADQERWRKNARVRNISFANEIVANR